MNKRRLTFSTKLSIIVSLILIVANFILGKVLVDNSRRAIMEQIDNRMLDIVNTAADMLDGDIMRDLKKEDKGTPEYDQQEDILRVFQDNINLEYIYGIRDMGNKEFTFTIDPVTVDPGEFGAPVQYTDALYQASLGTPAVDGVPYTDEWGRFYSAYSPVFDSQGNVAGIVAVDFSADWYDAQIAEMNRVIFYGSLYEAIIGVSLIVWLTNKMRQDMVKHLEQRDVQGEQSQETDKESGDGTL